jgi:outer membrane protein assembly factor BamB
MLLGNGLAASEAPSDGGALLEATGIRGGLALVVGAKDTRLARALAAASALYVQVLQPDADLAAQWGAEFSAQGFQEREKLGVRCAPFTPDHYGTNLFNLILVESSAALRTAKLADLCRILVPRGHVAFRDPPAGYAAEARTLEMESSTVGGFRAVFRRPVTPFEWRPADGLKWRAGMRAHMAVGICGPTHGSGKFFYREWLEAKGEWPKGRSRLYARDAYNGRVVWTREEGVGWKRWRVGQRTRANWSLGADEAGRLFAVTLAGKFVCLDAETGKQRFELVASGARPGYVHTYRNQYVLYAGTVFSAETGKRLWQWKGRYTALHEDALVESDGEILRVRALADGAEILEASLAWRGDRVKKPMGLLHVGSHILVTEGHRWERPYRVTALDAATGAKLWTHELGGAFAWPARGEKGKTFSAIVSYTRLDDKLLAYASTRYYYDRYPHQKEIRFIRIDLATGNVEQEDYGPKGKLFGNACATDTPRRLGDYLFYHHNVWLNIRTLQRRYPYLVHPGCDLPPPAAYGMIYNTPGRKGHNIQGITAIGPADIEFGQAPGGKVFHRYAPRPAFREPTKAGDWPTFRANNARSNFVHADLKTRLRKAWEAKVGMGGRSFGQMYAERFGLTQPVIAYDTVYVADISAQRIVALDVKDGRQKWVYHVGSRVDFPPTIHKGLCLFAAKDGFVYCLAARTGRPIYRLLVAPRERYIGGHEKLESLWPTAADVMVDAKGIARAAAGFASTAHGGYRVVTFEADTGKVLESKCHFEEFAPAGYPRPKGRADVFTEPLKHGWRLCSGYPMDDMLGYGNSISRTNEDRAHALFRDAPRASQSRARGRVITFDEKLCVAWFMPYGGAAWGVTKPLYLMAAEEGSKEPLWQSPPIEMIHDDIVLSPSYAYCVGHYRRVTGSPEIWVVSRQDGKILSKTPVDGFPSYLGTSASGNRLFVSTREGKLLCFTGETGE